MRSEIDYSEIREAILSLLSVYSEIIEADTYSAVMQYLQHGEYEMAFEGLLIDLINAKFEKQKINIDYYLSLGQVLGLDKNTVFNPNFWNDFVNYLYK